MTKNMNNKIILFSTYSDTNKFRNTVFNTRLEINKNMKPWDKLVILTNHRNIDSKILSKASKFWEIFFVENKSFDFGMYYQWMLSNLDTLNDYEELYLINDSVSVIKPLDWVFKALSQQEDWYYWIIDAYSGNETIKEIKGRHIQSWFLRMKWEAIDLFKKYIIKHWFVATSTTDIWSVIQTYEFGLSKLMKKNNIKCWVLYSSDWLMKEFDLKKSTTWDFVPTWTYYDILLRIWFPFFKNSITKYNISEWPRIIINLLNKIYYLNQNINDKNQNNQKEENNKKTQQPREKNNTKRKKK